MTVLILGHVWPEPTSSAAGSRMMQLIEVFRSQKWEVHFASAAEKGVRAAHLEEKNLQAHSIKINNPDFSAFAKAINPQIVLYDRFMVEEQLGWRVRESCPEALQILDTEDLHGLRKARENALRADRPFMEADLFNDTAKREIASIYRCDLSLIISEIEMELLKTFFGVPGRLLFYLPFMVRRLSDRIGSRLMTYEQRTDFMSIGNFKHFPNLDAVRYLKSEIWPKIRAQLPKTKLHVYGAYPTQEVFQMDDKEKGFLVHGYVKNAAEAMQNARICLAPLRIGAGLKGKILESMQNGTPCISTSVAAEGMYGEFSVNGTIADDPDEFARETVTFYTDKSKWEIAQQDGFNAVNARFDKQRWLPLLMAQLRSILENLNAHRLKNFTGALLSQQSHQATKYMSRWIEEKNKPR